MATDKAVKNWANKGKDDEGGGGDDRPDRNRIQETIRKEAKSKGATLSHPDGGGVPAQLALKVFRKFGYQCPRCKTRRDIGLHHKGGIVDSKKLDKMGHEMTEQNLAVLCEKCHDAIHQMARKKGIDSSQVTPEGDR